MFWFPNHIQKQLTLLLCRRMSKDLSCKISSCFCAYSICIWHPLCCPCRMSCSPWNRVCFIFYVLHMFLNQIACRTKISKMWCRLGKQSLDKQSRTPRKLPLCNQLYKPLLLSDFSLDARTKKNICKQRDKKKQAQRADDWHFGLRASAALWSRVLKHVTVPYSFRRLFSCLECSGIIRLACRFSKSIKGFFRCGSTEDRAAENGEAKKRL